MKDLKEAASNSLFAKNSVVIYTFFMATLGGFNAIWEISNKWEESQKPEQAVVLIEAVDFQDAQFDKVVINFRNATSSSTSINNVGLLCKDTSGQVLRFHAFNNEVGKHKQIFDVSKFDATPKHLKSGESIRLDTLYQKVGSIKPINQQCVAIAPLWSDNEFKTHTGDWIELSTDTVGGSYVVLEQS
ncbi:hypothetical protein C9980_25915 [Vibrio mediterranei]|jgi:hypothetical protein|uniref:hypothetical protein n=1 Tax=Vibrio mediterranei TaxID=689 RepID=UPI000D180C07|nr:hypothetical protein [Vibrio mediterranei]PTC01875.1 hypothetical protein C9980_25915 [Vibrio mediterranei]